MRVIKRNGKTASFNPKKIRNAIQKAGFVDNDSLDRIVDVVTSEAENRNGKISIEEIQDIVELELMKTGNEKVAREYIRYRKMREMIRENELTNESILRLIDDKNEYLKTENSNKNHTIASTQRDYIAGEVSKDISMRLILPKEVVDAHKRGALHAHDLDYMIQHTFNCFSSKTRFVTDQGVMAFKDCSDGQIVNVLTKDGNWARATVRKYGRRTMQNVTLQSGRTVKVVKCTPDHRWVLKDGTVTTELKVGDRLYCLHEMNHPNIEPDEFFCLGMVLADGNDTYCRGHEDTAHYFRIRLCGKKTKYIGTFIKNGYRLSETVFENGDVILTKKTKITKKGFLEARAWEILSPQAKYQLFQGYFAGDGSDPYNTVTTTNPYVLEMIRDLSAVTGRHVTAVDHIIRDTNFKKGAEMDTVRFMKRQPSNKNWIVKKIEIDPHHDAYDAWCVEEPTTHTFTLDGGIVTGNCCLIDLEDILQNGTVINGTMIEKPHSFSTACNIATQVSAIIASNQYGGQTMSFTHLAPFVDVSRQRFRNELREEFPNLEQTNKEQFDRVVESRVRDEVRRGVQTIQYQILTLNSSNG